MKVFVSSLISGLEPLRAAAREAITTLRHEPVMAEDFGARPDTPQVACLTGLRQADVVVLIMGARYGAVQASGQSATHEEYEEAKGRKTVFAFVEELGERETLQADFLREVQGWESGLFRTGFRTAADLRQAMTRALHDHALANATGQIDQTEMAEHAAAMLPAERRNYSGRGSLGLAVAGGPCQSILRPVEIERSTLSNALLQRALFGEPPVFDTALGNESAIEENALVITQDRGAQIVLNEQGSIGLTLPVKSNSRMMPELIHEEVLAHFVAALAYASWVLDHIDPTQRLTHVAIAAVITGADHLPWRTQRESDASPNSYSLGDRSADRAPVQIGQSRAALRVNAANIVEDLVVSLRRQWR
jgi:hypothetical protein